MKQYEKGIDTGRPWDGSRLGKRPAIRLIKCIRSISRLQNAELHQAQEQLTAACDRYRDLYDYSPVGYLTISVEGRILQANLTSAGLLGVTRHDLVHQPLSRFIAHDGQESYHFLRLRLGRNDAPWTVDLPLVKRMAQRFWHVLTPSLPMRQSPIMRGKPRSIGCPSPISLPVTGGKARTPYRRIVPFLPRWRTVCSVTRR